MIATTDEMMKERLLEAMNKGAAFSAKVCAMEGAFGYGVPITGKTEI
jgi:fructoselysine 6-kinase